MVRMNADVADVVVPRTEVLLYKVTDVARMLNLSRTVVFEQLRAGRLQSVKQGRTRLIPAIAVQKYVELLMSESQDVA
jgi:excisionase family DNA binding protein